jgi:hypothetical protein
MLLAEQAAIAFTPEWPHHVDIYRHWTSHCFFWSLGTLSVIRFVGFLCHWRERKALFSFLLTTGWRKNLGPPSDQVRQLVDLVHALATGLLSHLLAALPFYMVLTQINHSLVFAPLRVVCDVLIFLWFLRSGEFNRWLYRDHWVCHHSEIAFRYLHAPHHDALPISIMAAHDTGMLEGFLRFSLSQPEVFATPGFAVVLFTIQVLADFVFHQYVPGIWPYSTTALRCGHHHVEHHFLSLHPLGSGFEHPPDGNDALNVDFDTEIDKYNPGNGLWVWWAEQVNRVEGDNKTQ